MSKARKSWVNGCWLVHLAGIRGILGTPPRVSGDFSVVIYHGSTSILLLEISIFDKLILFFFVFASYNAPNVMF